MNEKQARPWTNCQRRDDAGLPGGALPAEMYGKEDSAPRLGPANFQDADLCPPEWPLAKSESADLVPGWLFLSPCERASVRRGQRCLGSGDYLVP